MSSVVFGLCGFCCRRSFETTLPKLVFCGDGFLMWRSLDTPIPPLSFSLLFISLFISLFLSLSLPLSTYIDYLCIYMSLVSDVSCPYCFFFSVEFLACSTRWQIRNSESFPVRVSCHGNVARAPHTLDFILIRFFFFHVCLFLFSLFCCIAWTPKL